MTPIRLSTDPVFHAVIDIRRDPDGVVTMRAGAGLSIEGDDNRIRVTSVFIDGVVIDSEKDGSIHLTMADDDSEWESQLWWDLQFIALARQLEA